MTSSLKLLVHLAVIGCFIGSTITYPIDDKEEVSKFQLTQPIGLPPRLQVSQLSSGASNGAIEGTINHESTNGAVVDINKKEASLPLAATASGQSLNQNIDQIYEPVATLGELENQKEADVEDKVNKSDITKAKTTKRNAEDDDETKWASSSYSFRQSNQNGKITEQVFEKERNIHDSSKDSDSLVRSDSDDTDSDDTDSDDSDSDSDSYTGSDTDIQTKIIKYVFRRSSDSQFSENFTADFQNNTNNKIVKKVESSVNDQPDNDNLDSRDSHTYGRSSSDNSNAYYEGESFNIYGNSNGAQRDGSLNPSYEEAYPEGDGSDTPEEYTDDYRRAKRNNEVDAKVLSIIKNLKGDSTKGQNDKDPPITDKPELDETLKLVKETELLDTGYENYQQEQPLEETVLNIPAYNDDGYGGQNDNEWNVKITGSDDTKDEPIKENNDEVEDTFTLSSDKESLNQETSQSYPSVDATPQRFNYRRVKRNNVFVLIAKKKGEPEGMTEITTKEVKIKNETLKGGDSTAEMPTEDGTVKEGTLDGGESTGEILTEEDKIKIETLNGGESQSNEKLEHEETPAITSNLELSNLDNEENQQENPSPPASQGIGSFTDYKTTRSKRSNVIKQKLEEIKKKIENEQQTKQINAETTNEEDKLTSEFNQQEEISSAVENPFSKNKDQSTGDTSSAVTYSNDYGRVSRNDDIPSSFGMENVESESDTQHPEDQFEENYDANGPNDRNDYHQIETPQFWNNQQS